MSEDLVACGILCVFVVRCVESIHFLPCILRVWIVFPTRFFNSVFSKGFVIPKVNGIRFWDSSRIYYVHIFQSFYESYNLVRRRMNWMYVDSITFLAPLPYRAFCRCLLGNENIVSYSIYWLPYNASVIAELITWLYGWCHRVAVFYISATTLKDIHLSHMRFIGRYIFRNSGQYVGCCSRWRLLL